MRLKILIFLLLSAHVFLAVEVCVVFIGIVSQNLVKHISHHNFYELSLDLAIGLCLMRRILNFEWSLKVLS